MKSNNTLPQITAVVQRFSRTRMRMAFQPVGRRREANLQKISLATLAFLTSLLITAHASGPAGALSSTNHGPVKVPSWVPNSLAALYQYDDGGSEDAIGFTNPPDNTQAFEALWFNQFDVISGANVITSVDIAWGTLSNSTPAEQLNGLPVTIAIWSDPDGDGDPADGLLLGSVASTIQAANTDTFITYTFPTSITVTGTSFFVGNMSPADPSSALFLEGLDQTTTARKSWLLGMSNGDPVDINNLGNNTFREIIDDNNPPFPGNWLIRANASVTGGGMLWYNGDFDGVDALGNEQDTSLGAGQFSHIYEDFNVTDSEGWDLTSVFSDNLTDTNITGATFEIRSGVSSGVPGTIVASGTTLTPIVTPTDRSGFGFPEFIVEVTGLDIHLDAGTYFLNVTPIGDLTGRSFDSTTSGANCIGTPCGGNANSFWDSNFFGVFFVPTGDAGAQFHDFSMGVNGTIAPGRPTITTQASGNVPVGGSVSDTATLSNGVAPTGTITFMLFGPNDATCGGAPVFTSTKDVTGNGSYISDPFPPATAGTYRWVASYSGDANNEPVSGACNDPNESVVVTAASPTITTQASGSVPVSGNISDTATLSNGVTPTGMITFMLFGPNDTTCGGAPIFTSTRDVIGNGSYTSALFTPTAAGTYRWVASYSGDVNNGSATGACNDPNESVVVTSSPPPPPPVITSGGSATGMVGESFNYQITATNNPTSFDAMGLPSGLTPDTSTGLISGKPTENGVFPVTLSATNPRGTGMKTLTLTVTPAVTGPVPEIISPLSATATVGQFYVYQIVATMTPTSYDAPNPPSGLSTDTTLGFISGTPTEAGTKQVTLSATNANGTGMKVLSLTVQPPPVSPISVVNGTSATGRTNSPFSFQVITSGGSSATQLSTSPLPPGLVVDPQTGEISGLPTKDGSFLVTLTVTDAGMSTTATLQLTFTSDPAIPVITSPGRTTLIPGQPFTYQIETSSDEPTMFYRLGPLPDGLELNQATGLISGKPLVSFGLQPLPDVAAGIITNTELVACNSHGCASKDLIFGNALGAANISTRLSVGTEGNVLIGGFIIKNDMPEAATPLEVVVRGIGPSLAQAGLSGVLANPSLQLRDSKNTEIGYNDDWMTDSDGSSQMTAIENSLFAPMDKLESAILAVLKPEAYTAILSGSNGGTGIGLVEVYNVGPGSVDLSGEAHLGNISTRGNVQTGDNVMIGGFINKSAKSIKVLVRGIGPSLTPLGVAGALADPVVELHDSKGATIATNDNWMSDPAKKADIIATGFAPGSDLESAILITLPPTSNQGIPYTAIVRGANGTAGVGLVEAYFGNPCLGTPPNEVCP